MIGKSRLLRGPHMSRARALFKAMGYPDEELSRPRIGVANTWGETSPGHYHLKNLAEAVKAGKLKKGEALILRYEGPRGGPGCTDIFGLMGYVGGAGLDADCALITDGKASGFCEGFYVVQVSPEAYVGGPLAIVQNGDMIDIDIPNGRLNVDIAADELERRMKNWAQPEPRIKRGFLTVYHRLALPAERGGGINLRL